MMTEPDLGRTICSDLDPRLLMQRIVEETNSLVPGASGSAILIHHDGLLRTVSAAGVTGGHVGHVGQVIVAGGSLSGMAMAQGRLLWSDDVTVDERVAPDLRDDPQARSQLTVPLRRGAQMLGVLVIVSARPGAFDGETRSRIIRLADFVGVALASHVETASAVRGVVDRLSEPISVIDAEGREHTYREETERVGEFLANVMRPGIVDELRARQRIMTVLRDGRVRSVLQPIVDVETGVLVGVEALARFDDRPQRPPDAWFAEANEVGLGLELELLAARRGLELLDALPPGVTLSINVSHELLMSGRVAELMEGRAGEHILVELTEHAAFDDYGRFRLAMSVLRARGVQLAIDDVGAGYSSFRHVVELEPECIKLDRLFTAGIEADPARRAMAEALIGFARRTGTDLIAEGIETDRELEVVRELGVRLGQGYRIARPGPVSALPVRFAHLGPAPDADAPAVDRGFSRYSSRVNPRRRRRERAAMTQPAPDAVRAELLEQLVR
jgi:EAL domain-containing protein (putative c-di-GMP-specific phosphodiesterase class I)/putative methionine-R-sulfoxide reductase with GAF domain